MSKIEGIGNDERTAGIQQLLKQQTQQLQQVGSSDANAQTAAPASESSLQLPEDKLEISEAGRQAYAEAQTLSSSQTESSGSAAQPAGASPASSQIDSLTIIRQSTSGALGAQEEDESEDDSDDSVSSQLYTLSEYELQQLVSSGAISQSEMNTELERRNGGSEEAVAAEQPE